MEHGTSLASLMVVVSVAFLVPVVLHRFHLRFLPVVVAEIVAGIIIGKSGFNLVSEDPYLGLLSALGLIYLMFLSGLELDFSIITNRQTGKQSLNVMKIGLGISAAALALSAVLAFGLQAAGLIDIPFFFMIVIAAVSLGVVVPVLKERRLLDTELGQAILFITVVLDMTAMVLLAFYISLRSQNVQDMLQLLLFFVLAFVAYRLIRFWLGRRQKNQSKVSEAIKSGTVQIGTRAVFALILLFVVMSETLGVEVILGAFLAGAIVSLTLPNKEFFHKLETFGYGFLIPVFFVMVGADLELGSLIREPAVLLLVPALLLCFFLAKMAPSIILKKWFPLKDAIAAGVLISANLSLVVAAAEVAFQAQIIDGHMRGALILVAILSCFIAPIAFSRMSPKTEPKRLAIGIVGANYITMPVSLDLQREQYDVELFSAQVEETDKEEKMSRFPVRVVEELTPEQLEQAGLFAKDVVVLGTADDDVNLYLAEEAKKRGARRVIARVEEPERMETEPEEDVQLISPLYATRTLLKAIIEHPSAVKLITQHDDSIQEAELNNPQYDGMLLRQLPFLGDVLVMRIFRGDSFLVPHGNTEVKLGDRLLISGDVEQVAAVKRILA